MCHKITFIIAHITIIYYYLYFFTVFPLCCRYNSAYCLSKVHLFNYISLADNKTGLTAPIQYTPGIWENLLSTAEFILPRNVARGTWRGT